MGVFVYLILAAIRLVRILKPTLRDLPFSLPLLMGTRRDVPSHCKDLIPGFPPSQLHRNHPWYVPERQSKGQGLQLALHGKEMRLVGINRKMFLSKVDVKEYSVVFCYTWGGNGIFTHQTTRKLRLLVISGRQLDIEAGQPFTQFHSF